MSALAKLTSQANQHHQDAAKCQFRALLHARKAGEALNRIKRIVKRRSESWGDWLRENFVGSHETANLY